MNRRFLFVALACWPMVRATAQDAGPRHKISAEQLHAAISKRFPLKFGVAGVIELEVSAPRLHLLPSRNQVGAGLVAQAFGISARQVPPGEMDVLFNLRYEPADQTVRGHKLEIMDLRLPGLAPEARRTAQSLLPLLARDAVGEIVLHRFSRRELELAETMGFEPERFEVAMDGVVIVFGPRQRR